MIMNKNSKDRSIADAHLESIRIIFNEVIDKMYGEKKISRKDFFSLSQHEKEVCEEIRFAVGRHAIPYFVELEKSVEQVLSDFMEGEGAFKKDLPEDSTRYITTPLRDEHEEEGEFLEYVIDKKTGDVRFIDNPEFMRRL